MKKIFLAFMAAAMLPALAASPAEAQCGVYYRIWQDGTNTYHRFGETIFLERGESVHLYIHYQSKSPDPYSTAADIAAPTAFGVGGQRPQDVARVLRLGAHDPRKGKQEMVAVAPGETALGYRITDVVRPGTLDQVPANCRTGQVRITVKGSGGQVSSAPPPPLPGPPPPAGGSLSPNEAAHKLIADLYMGILRRSASEARDYPDSFFDNVVQNGHSALVQVAEEMTASSEFRTAALERTRKALAAAGMSTDRLSPAVLQDQLLADIYRSLYGGVEPPGQLRARHAADLSACLSGGGSEVCRRLGRTLLSQRQYADSNYELLRHWGFRVRG